MPARVMTLSGHHVWDEEGAGLGSGIYEKEYSIYGAGLVADPQKIYSNSEMIVKVKEPIEEEYAWLQKDQIVFAYLHLATLSKLLEAFKTSGSIAFAFEMV